LPGSVVILRTYSTSWNSGPILRKVELSNVALKLKQKDFPGVGRFYRWQGEGTARVTRAGGTFGVTFEVPVCVVMTATLDGGIKWIVTLESAPFTFTDAGGTTRIGQFGNSTGQYLGAVTTPNCGDCSGGLTGPVTQTTGNSGSRFGAYCDAPTQGPSTLTNWNGGWSADVYGTLATDSDCVGCSAVYAEFKPCKQSDTRVFWSKVNDCSIPPGTCTIVTDPGLCVASTGNTYPITSTVPAGVTLIDPICFNSETSVPQRTCCSCRRPDCCDTRDGTSITWENACTSDGSTGVTGLPDLPCTCHQSATATVVHTGSGTTTGSPGGSTTIAGSFSGTKTGCNWTWTGSVTSTFTPNGGGSPDVTTSTNPFQLGLFPITGGTGSTISDLANSCGTVKRRLDINTSTVGFHEWEATFTYGEGDCGGMPCGCGSGGVVASTQGAVDDLDSFFGGIA
jgi:hypothetical protein